MKVFVTGASGHIGQLVTAELMKAGHTVVGLVRSDASALTLTALGAEVIRGTLQDIDIIKAAAKSCDGVIHLAFRHDIAFSGRMDEAIASDRAVLVALGEALAGTGKPLVGTSGTLMLALAGITDMGVETDTSNMPGRAANEAFVIGLASHNVRTSVIRLAPTVHGPSDNPGAFVPTLIKIAHGSGYAAYVGDGKNRWPAIHELDAARLFRLALEEAPAGTRLHGVGDQGIPFKQIAETIAEKLGVPTQSITQGEALTHFGPLGTFAGLDNATSNALTCEVLHWQPTHPGLLEDLRHGNYFAPYT